MKNILLSIFIYIILSFSIANAQSGAKPKSGASKQNFYTVQKAFNKYWENKSKDDVNKEKEDEEKDGEWQQFKRWEWFMEQRVYPSGNFFDPEILVNEYIKYKASHPQEKSLNDRSSANWSFVGPGTVPNNGGGAGRIDCITFDPTNSNILYIGSASGGLWKSTDGGSTWASSNTDLLPALSISDICIDPQNTSTMYIATGDKYGYVSGSLGFWGGNYSAGLLKSTDGGATWNPTGLNYTQTQTRIIQRIVINPTNTNVLIVATNSGLFRTTTGGTSWTNVKAGNFLDLKINPHNPNVLYASDTLGVYRSNDGGINWHALSANLCPGGRNSLAITPADTSVIYTWCEGGNFFKSTNGGLTFTQLASPNTTAGPYGYYDQVICVSPVDANAIYTGGLNIANSIDGGNSWNTITDWAAWPASNYVHGDNHCMIFLPGNGSTVFSCNDGGIFKTTDGGNSWSNLSNGLNIKQYYRIACSALTPGLMYAGAQDNGTDKINGFAADQVVGGDGMQCLVDYTNDNNVYVSYEGGDYLKSTDGGATFTDITPAGTYGTGDWTTPMVMDPINPQILYVAYTDVYKSIDGGTTWNTISNNIAGGSTIYSIAVAPSNPSYLYVASYGNIFKTIDGGTTWTTITQNLPVTSAAITKIAISSTNPDNVYVTFSGYSNGNKVFSTTDGGLSWTNISGTLPNIPVNCIVFQNGNSNSLYIGTEFGVYYTDATMSDWVTFNTGLPNVIIDDLEIQYSASKLRAATYGRGIWETDLNTSTLFSTDAGALTILLPTSSAVYCNPTIIPSVRIENFGQSILHSVTLNYKMDGGAVNTYLWNGTLATFATADITLPSTTLSPGNHTFVSYTSNPNSVSDNNPSNDNRSVSFQVNGAGLAPPVIEGFISATFPPTGWTLQNSSTLLSRVTSAGGFGNSGESMEANCFTATAGTIEYFISPTINFSNLIAPVKLDFNVAHAQYDSTYHDSLFIAVSTDCGATYTNLYSKTDPALGTAPPTTSSFIPSSSQWRAESINLNQFIGSPDVIVRFEIESGYGNNIYIDDINIHTANTTGIDQLNDNQNVFVYPNPGHDQLTISGLSFSNNEKINVGIYNAIGEKISEGVITKNTIDINPIKPGIYFIKISTDKGSITRQFVKQ
jgi:photosystem II stability/assembly factor-like uncharacterized protein